MTTPLAEYSRGLWSAHAWLLLAWDDIRNRYKRTALGPLWLTLSHGLLVGGIAFAFSTIFGRPLGEYFVYVAAGLTIWYFISSSITEGPTIFLRAQNLLHSYNLPASVHIFRFVSGQIITFGHQLVIYVIALTLAPQIISPNMLWAIPALALLAAAAVGWSTLLSFLGARFRDLAPAIGAVTHMCFMLTPIFWERAMVEDKAPWFVWFNPFFHLIEVLRAPLLGRPPDPINWIVAASIAAALIGLGLWLYSHKRARLSYWI